jgi:hypothetical protein
MGWVPGPGNCHNAELESDFFLYYNPAIRLAYLSADTEVMHGTYICGTMTNFRPIVGVWSSYAADIDTMARMWLSTEGVLRMFGTDPSWRGSGIQVRLLYPY